MKPFRSAWLTVFVAVGLLPSASAFAQDYPARPVRIVLGFGAGGTLLAIAAGYGAARLLRQNAETRTSPSGPEP